MFGEPLRAPGEEPASAMERSPFRPRGGSGCRAGDLNPHPLAGTSLSGLPPRHRATLGDPLPLVATCGRRRTIRGDRRCPSDGRSMKLRPTSNGVRSIPLCVSGTPMIADARSCTRRCCTSVHACTAALDACRCSGQSQLPGQEPEVKSQRLVHRCYQVRGQVTDLCSDPFNRHRPDLFGLSLGVVAQPGPRRRQKNLERIIPIGPRGHRDHCEHTSPGRSAVPFAPSLLTMTAGRRLVASVPRTGSKSRRAPRLVAFRAAVIDCLVPDVGIALSGPLLPSVLVGTSEP